MTSTQLTLLIDVVDSNDERPMFVDAPYTVNVTEDTPVGSVLLTVRATDRDGEPPRDTSPLTCGDTVIDSESQVCS